MDLPGQITVFAPVDAAFDVMTEGHLAYLSSPEVRTKEPFLSSLFTETFLI